jgi:hypothetical protein
VYLSICSFLLCLSWLLRSRVRKFRTDLWITLCLSCTVWFTWMKRRRYNCAAEFLCRMVRDGNKTYLMRGWYTNINTTNNNNIHEFWGFQSSIVEDNGHLWCDVTHRARCFRHVTETYCLESETPRKMPFATFGPGEWRRYGASKCHPKTVSHPRKTWIFYNTHIHA